ncbi:MAG: signal transduction histidine kinase [Candidatus Latescibacterota bacterium]|jgi:signal transduction histidine kinase
MPFSPVGIPVLGLPKWEKGVFLSKPFLKRMSTLTSIRRKTLLFISIALLVFCAGILVLSRTVMLDGYLDLETRDMQQQLNRVQKGVESYVDVLNTTAFDWATWDDAYDFVITGDSEFIQSNLVDEVFNETGLGISLIVFLDTEKQVVFQKGYDQKKRTVVEVPQGVFGHLTDTGLTLEKAVNGLLLLPEGLFVVVSHPILTSKQTGPAHGQLLMGRRFDADQIKRLGEQLELDLTLFSIDGSGLPGVLKDAYAHVMADSSGWIGPLAKETLAGVTVLRDIYGKPAGLVEVTRPREIYQRGIDSTRSVLGAVAAIGVLLSIILLLVLERLVLSPLKQMRSDIQKVEGLRDLSLRVGVGAGDELGELARVMNEMLGKLDNNEREMVRLERLSALGEMAAGINHNLNNILVGVTMSSEFLMDRVKDEKSLEFVRTIYRAGKQAADLVARLQDAVLGDSDEGALQSLNAIVRDSVETARTRWKDEADLKGIEIRILLDLANGLPPVRGSSSGLYNIVLNLIFNAVDAMPDGGELEIQSRQMGGGVQISVRDTGVGMDEETRKRVFEPFFTTKFELGTGLGLATVYNTVVRWGGRVDVDSVEGAGSVFTLWFPAEGVSQTPPEDRPAVASSKGHILVVDDHDVITELVEHVLSPLHTVSCLGDSLQVLPALTQAEYDVVVLDLGMPGMPGDKVAEAVRLQSPLVSLVLMTGWRLEDDDPRLGLFDFVLKKPLHDVQVVRDVVAQAVNLSRKRRKELIG